MADINDLRRAGLSGPPCLYKHRDRAAYVHMRVTTYGRDHTDTGIRVTLSENRSEHAKTVLSCRLPREQALALAQAILAEAEPNPTHIIEFRADGWTIQHPLACRPNLFACPLNRIAETELDGTEIPAGRYECELNDIGDRLLIGDRLPEATDG